MATDMKNISSGIQTYLFVLQSVFVIVCCDACRAWSWWRCYSRLIPNSSLVVVLLFWSVHGKYFMFIRHHYIFTSLVPWAQFNVIVYSLTYITARLRFWSYENIVANRLPTTQIFHTCCMSSEVDLFALVGPPAQMERLRIFLRVQLSFSSVVICCITWRKFELRIAMKNLGEVVPV